MQDMEDPGTVVYADRVGFNPGHFVLFRVKALDSYVEFLHAATFLFSIPSRFFAMNVWPYGECAASHSCAMSVRMWAPRDSGRISAERQMSDAVRHMFSTMQQSARFLCEVALIGA